MEINKIKKTLPYLSLEESTTHCKELVDQSKSRVERILQTNRDPHKATELVTLPNYYIVWYNGKSFISVNLKHGSQWIYNHYLKHGHDKPGWFGVQIKAEYNSVPAKGAFKIELNIEIVNIYSKLENHANFNTLAKIKTFLLQNFFKESEIPILLVTRDTSKRVLSGFSQAIKNHKTAAYLTQEFEKYDIETATLLNDFTHNYPDGTPWALEEFYSTESLSKLSNKYVRAIKKFIKFCLKEKFDIISTDYHVSISANFAILNYLNYFMFNKMKNNAKIFNLDTLSSRPDICKLIFDNGYLNAPSNETNSTQIHSSKGHTELIRQTMIEMEGSDMMPIYNMIEKEAMIRDTVIRFYPKNYLF